MIKINDDRFPYNFIILYATTYMANSVYSNFVPIYLNNLGFEKLALGILLSLGPLISIAAQPIWGIAGDRAKYKNTMLKVLLLGSGAVAALFPVSRSFLYLAFIISVFSIFQSSVNPLSDAITLEYLETTRWKFGPIRLAGTFGFACMSVVAGIIAKENISNIFILYPIIVMFSLWGTFRLPLIKGHQSSGNRVSILALWKNRELMLLMLFNLLIQTSLGFYYSFFPIYFTQMGGSSTLLGVAMFISATSELPFLLLASGMMDKINIKYILVISSAVIGLRWLFIHFVTNVYLLLPAMLFHGFSYIVFAYSMATYINREVPRELRASGQTINWLIGFGIARIIGSIAGGYLTGIVSIRQVFLYDSILAFASMAIFGCIFVVGDLKHRQSANPLNNMIKS